MISILIVGKYSSKIECSLFNCEYVQCTVAQKQNKCIRDVIY